MLVRIPRTMSATLAALAMTVAPLAAQQSVRLPARDRLLTERPSNVFTVGAIEGESWEMLSGVRGVAFDDHDNLYVLDGQNTRVLVFDARGRFLRQFGRRGGGPGELQVPVHIAVTTDGNVVVNDPANRALVVFSPMGEHVRNIPLAPESGFPAALFADPRGGVVTRINDATPGAVLLSQSSAGGVPTTSRIQRQSLAGDAPPVTLARFSIAAPQVVQTGGTAAQRQFTVRMDPVFAARPTFGVLPDGGVALHTETEYRIRIIDGSGRHVRTLTRDYKPRRVTRKDQEAYEARRQEAQARGGANSTMIIAMGGASGSTSTPGPAPSPLSMSPTFAEHMSVISSIRTDPAGRLWVQRRQDDGGESGPIDLLDASGRYIGSLPAQQLPRAISATGLAAYVTTDDMGVERVAVRRLPGTWR